LRRSATLTITARSPNSTSLPPDEPVAVEFHVEDNPDPLDIEVLEPQIRREASAAMGLGDEVELAIFVRDAGKVVAGISGWTWGDCCELQSLWVKPSLRGRGLATRLIAAAETEAAARGCTRTVHFTYGFQARALYERNGYELGGSSRGLPIGNRRALVPQAPEPRTQGPNGRRRECWISARDPASEGESAPTEG
jgi:GNAT superfamily N-acetyltransferase